MTDLYNGNQEVTIEQEKRLEVTACFIERESKLEASVIADNSKYTETFFQFRKVHTAVTRTFFGTILTAGVLLDKKISI